METPTDRPYDAESLSVVQDPNARKFLQEVGLPVNHLLFAVAEPAARAVDAGGQVRELLRIGEGGDYEEFCVDTRSGEVASLNTIDSSVWHVNESPAKFLRCLEEFTSRYPYGNADTDLEEREMLADSLKEALLEIDPTALNEDPGFWETVLGDVAIGDYAED